jgi:hypothetical protein
MIHLARFTGAPASRASELVAQIAAAVEGLSAVTWQDEPPGPSSAPTGADPCPTRTREEMNPCRYSDASATSSPLT